jgi:hypothetical protein
MEARRMLPWRSMGAGEVGVAEWTFAREVVGEGESMPWGAGEGALCASRWMLPRRPDASARAS